MPVKVPLLMYLSVGFISLAGVVKAGLPFNIRRGVLALTSIFAFVCAVALFSGFLQLPRLSPAGRQSFPLCLYRVLLFHSLSQNRKKCYKKRGISLVFYLFSSF